MHSGLFVELTALLAISTVIALIMRALKQPLIIGYILTGLLVGPAILGLVDSPDTIAGMGSFGVALLLFVVGLGLNPKIIKEVGKVSVLTGLGQVLLTTTVAFIVVTALGLGTTAALYVAVAMAFSSTIIILKLLSDKKDQSKLYGKVSIGFLLVQDVVATIALFVASASGNNSLTPDGVAILLGQGAALIGGTMFVAHFIIRRMTNFLSSTQELLFLFAIAWGFGVAALFFQLGFSIEVGALLAGVSLASMPYAQEVSSRLRPLRDFFIIVFFIALGAEFNFGDVDAIIGKAIILSALVLVGNPIIVMTIMGLLGFTKRTSFKAGLTVAQISEFSIIFVLIGLRNEQIPSEIVTLVTTVAMITIAISAYMIIYSDKLYSLLERYLTLFEKRKTKPEKETAADYDALMFGYARGGNEYIKTLSKITKNFVVIDYNPTTIDHLEGKNIPYLYGDVTDPELLSEVNFDKVKLVVSIITDHATNLFILQETHKRNEKTAVICHAESIKEAVELYALGASFVVMPHHIGNEKVSAFLRKNGFKKSEFNKYRRKHLEYLQTHYEPNVN